MRQFITTKIEEIEGLQGNVIYDRLPIKTDLPLVTFKLPNWNEFEKYRDDILLEINIWTGAKPDDIKFLEDISKRIDEKINRLKHLDLEKQVSIYRFNPYKTFFDDPDPDIKRCKLQYVAKTYFF